MGSKAAKPFVRDFEPMPPHVAALFNTVATAHGYLPHHLLTRGTLSKDECRVRDEAIWCIRSWLRNSRGKKYTLMQMAPWFGRNHSAIGDAYRRRAGTPLRPSRRNRARVADRATS